MAGISISDGLNFKKSSRGDALEPSSVRYSRHRIAAYFFRKASYSKFYWEPCHV